MSRPIAITILGAVIAGTVTLAVSTDEGRDTGVVAIGDPAVESAATTTSPPTSASARAVEERRDRVRSTRGASSTATTAAPTTAAPTTAAPTSAAPSTSAAAAPQSWRDAPGADAAACAESGRSIVVDKQWQRAWFCQDGAVGEVIPITTAANQPDAGTYDVYAEDYQSWSTLTGQPATLDRFVAFTYGKYQGLRIGFHAVPYYADGTKVQPLESVGDLARFGESSGCIRVLPEHAEAIYSSLSLGDEVRVIS
ncbi:MAG: L,D-transpeptidase [Acidimicrobiia bacterium]|nr:L,D-transpeptidase [Acidimicrobiia bacterium]